MKMPQADQLRTASATRDVSVQVQSILYMMDHESIEHALESLERAVDLAIGCGACSKIRVSYGDTSPQRCLSDEDLERMRERFSYFELTYQFFNANLGSARGHNELSRYADTDYLLILNPDIVVSPRIFENLLEPFADPTIGMVEAKQLPIEHPKDYDPVTGETGWATTACALTPTPLFREIDGFDADTFFLYCDDVDYSWRVREAGLKVIYAPNAVVFHDKRIAPDGAWQPSRAERRYSAEAALLMAHKWSRPDIVEAITASFRAGNDDERAALTKFEDMKAAGKLPQPRDHDNVIGDFIEGMYTKHRFAL